MSTNTISEAVPGRGLPRLRCPPVQLDHNVVITDDSANWLRWGELIKTIVAMLPDDRPEKLVELKALMDAANVDYKVKGGDDRAIDWAPYNDDITEPLKIPLPTKNMVKADIDLLTEIGTRQAGCRAYPLPLFYAAIFGGAARVDLSPQELLDMGARRLGEYVINECM